MERGAKAEHKVSSGGGARRIESPVQLLMRQYPGAASPEDAMRRAARGLVSWARDMGWIGPPFRLELLASLLGIKIRPGGRELLQDALIQPIAGERFEIVYRPDGPETRRNFSIGHEISHTFFPDCANAIRYRGPRHKCDPEQYVEELCDLGASELLLPTPEFDDDVLAVGVSIAGIEKLRQRYLASYEAVAIRMLKITSYPCAAAFLTRRLKPLELRQPTLPGMTDPQPRMRVDFMVCSPSFGSRRMPKHKSIPDDSCVYTSVDSGRGSLDCISEGREHWATGKGSRLSCRIEATALPSNDAGEARALALLYPLGR